MLQSKRKEILTLLFCEDGHYQWHQIILFMFIGECNDVKKSIIFKLKDLLSDARFPYFDLKVSEHTYIRTLREIIINLQ